MSDLVIPPITGKRVGLFVTCLVDWLRPRIGFAALELLEQAGCDVVVSERQTCCGQPGYNSGDSHTARDLALMWAEEFADCNYVVVPSGSCAGMIKTHYPRLFEVKKTDMTQQEPLASPIDIAKVQALATKTYELSDFLVNIRKLKLKPKAGLQRTITYHDSCSGLRELGVKQQPRSLLEQIPGITQVPLPRCEECCGFGGAFSVKYGNISNALVADKCQDIQSTGADAVVMGDLGCMMNVDGALRRRGDQHTQVLHWVEVCAPESKSKNRPSRVSQPSTKPKTWQGGEL